MKFSTLTKGLLIMAAVAAVASLFVPLWTIYLDAPQYPEGLKLQIWANNLTGNIDVINGLNHYIGMKTLRVEDFIEFKVLPYFLVGFAILFLATAFIGRKKLLYIVFWSFITFGIVSIIDFWKWEYDYGHDLNPNAAIKVPGMAYQPPLIGYKKLLNFGAFAMPDVGGWLLSGVGIFLIIAVLNEGGYLKKFGKKQTIGTVAMFLLFFMLQSCGNRGPDPIQLNKDTCSSCKMSISQGNFAAELITKKGRTYKFDDMFCLKNHIKENAGEEGANFYIGDYTKENELIDATTAWYVQSENISSPMGGQIAAFADKAAAEKLAAQHQTQIKSWNDIKSSAPAKETPK